MRGFDVSLPPLLVTSSEIASLRFAAAYLAALLPSVRRILWMHTDTLVLNDVIPLYATDLKGAPAAAVDVCEPPLQLVQDVLGALTTSRSCLERRNRGIWHARIMTRNIWLQACSPSHPERESKLYA